MISRNRPAALVARLESRFCVDISRFQLLSTGKYFVNTNKAQLFSLSSSIEWYQEIGLRPWWLAWRVDYVSIYVDFRNLLLVTIFLGHVEQQLFILSCSIEKYQEIGPWTLWCAWVVVSVSIQVDISKFPLVKSKLRHVEQKLFSLLNSIERYREIGLRFLWLAWRVELCQY